MKKLEPRNRRRQTQSQDEGLEAPGESRGQVLLKAGKCDLMSREKGSIRNCTSVPSACAPLGPHPGGSLLTWLAHRHGSLETALWMQPERASPTLQASFSPLQLTTRINPQACREKQYSRVTVPPNFLSPLAPDLHDRRDGQKRRWVGLTPCLLERVTSSGIVGNPPVLTPPLPCSSSGQWLGRNKLELFLPLYSFAFESFLCF